MLLCRVLQHLSSLLGVSIRTGLVLCSAAERVFYGYQNYMLANKNYMLAETKLHASENQITC